MADGVLLCQRRKPRPATPVSPFSSEIKMRGATSARLLGMSNIFDTYRTTTGTSRANVIQQWRRMESRERAPTSASSTEATRILRDPLSLSRRDNRHK